jgi:hypothetical protein
LLFEAAQSEANAAELSAKAVAPFERPRGGSAREAALFATLNIKVYQDKM